MSYKTGQAKSLDDITLEDVIKYPIWEWALDEEGVERQDETWQKPVIDTDNVTAAMYYPTITVRVQNTNYYGCGEYNRNSDQITAISIWKNDKWIDLRQFTEMPTPLIFIALPRLYGENNVEFICFDIAKDRAVRK
jgi:hypothetical protein